MAKQGTYTAYQNLKPTTGFDPAQALMDVEQHNILVDQHRLANERFEQAKKQYDDGRKDIFAKAFAGDLDAIGQLAIQTGQLGLDEGLMRWIKKVPDLMLEMEQDYGSLEAIYSDPVALAKFTTLKNSAKYVSKATEYVGGLITDISEGMKPGVDKNGKPTKPRYSGYAQKFIDDVQNIVDGKVQIDFVNGRPIAAIGDSNGGLQMIDIASLAQGKFKDMPMYVDYDEYLNSWNEANGRLGKLKITEDKNGRTIVNDTFDNVRSKVRDAVKDDFGSYKNYTDFGLSFLSEKVGLTPGQIDNMTEEAYNIAIDSIVDSGIGTSYKGEIENTANTQLMSVNETARHNRATESLARDKYNLDVKKENRISKNGKSYSTHVSTDAVGIKRKSYSIPKGESVYIDSETGDINIATGKNAVEVKGQKYDNIVVNEFGRVYLTDGNKSVGIDENGLPSVVNQLGFNTVDEFLADAKNDLNTYQSTSNTETQQQKGSLNP